MSFHLPDHVYAQMVSPPVKEKSMLPPASEGTRKIEVKETGTASHIPDRVKCIIICTNCKETVEAAKQSVERRVSYIQQTFRANSVKENQYTVHQLTRSTQDGFKVTAEIVVTYHSVQSYEKVTNVLVEKLEKSIKISPPVFEHSKGSIENLRRIACMNAVKHARTKALSIAQFLNQTLGAPLLVREEDCHEHSTDSNDENDPRSLLSDEYHNFNIQSMIQNATVSYSVNVYIVFEAKSRLKKGTS